MPGRRWSPQEVAKFKQLINGNTPTRVLGMKLDRTEESIRCKASELDISLKPTNQSP